MTKKKVKIENDNIEVITEKEIVEVIEDKKDMVSLVDVIKNNAHYTVKSYLPIVQKTALISSIVDLCTKLNEEGMLVVDYCYKHLSMCLTIIISYTNIDISNFGDEEAYDALEEHGVMQEIFNKMNPDEVKFLNDTLEAELKQKEIITNCVEGIINRALNKAVDKLPDAKDVEKITKNILKFNPDKLKFMVDQNEKWNGTFGGKTIKDLLGGFINSVKNADKKSIDTVE